MHRIALVALIAGCWSSSKTSPSPPAPVETAAPAPAKPTRTPECVATATQTVMKEKAYACAVEAFEARDYANADQLADWVISRFPYAPIAHQAEVLRADILVEKRDYAGAVKAYDLWLKGHSTSDLRETVERKRNLARQSIR